MALTTQQKIEVATRVIAQQSADVAAWLAANLNAQQRQDFIARFAPEPTQDEKLQALKTARRRLLDAGDAEIVSALDTKIEALETQIAADLEEERAALEDANARPQLDPDTEARR